jgi:DNA-binding GntR family transcriptional regulator
MPKTQFFRSRKISKSHGVYEALRRLIMLGELKPAEPLAEMQIAQQYQCSQGPVREALLRLQEEGLVNRMGYHGTVVSAVSAPEISEFLVLRKLVETRGIVRAIGNINDKEVEALVDLVDAMDAAATANDEFTLSEVDRAFHLDLFRFAHLDALEPVLQRCLLHVHRYKISLMPPIRTLEQTAEGHRPIVESLRNRDKAAAARAVSLHIDTVCGGAVPILSSSANSIGEDGGPFDTSAERKL